MKRILISCAAMALSSTAALAAVDVMDLDTDGDGFASQTEVMAVYPKLSQREFDQIDANRDGRLDAQEIYNAKAQQFLVPSAQSDDAMAPEDQEAAIRLYDFDGDHAISIEELKAAIPEIQAADFNEIDTNDDNTLSVAELNTAEAGRILTKNL